MIQIKKPKYEHDNYCACYRKPFEDSMQISFSHKDYKDSVSITLCGKCREELRKALAKDINVPTKEIIHCKECKFYGRADKRRFYRGSDCLNKRIDTIVPGRDFCSRAEKRGETDGTD